jgi:hypothetical protein
LRNGSSLRSYNDFPGRNGSGRWKKRGGFSLDVSNSGQTPRTTPVNI